MFVFASKLQHSDRAFPKTQPCRVSFLKRPEAARLNFPLKMPDQLIEIDVHFNLSFNLAAITAVH
jgi:hypothetical protein